jgi:hypothetical protein
MTKTEKRILKGALGGTVGCIGGSVLGLIAGCVMSPIGTAMNLTAPVSYPIYGAVLGASIPGLDNWKHRALAAGAGLVYSTCMIPTAPIGLIWSTTLPVTGTVLGGIAGTIGGALMGTKEL